MTGSFEQPVFLYSMPRSGSTLLSLMLGSHPAVCCPPEPWIVLVVAEYLQLGNVKNIPYGREWAEAAAIEFFLHIEKKQRGKLNQIFSALGATLTNEDAVISARKILQAIYKAHLNVADKSVFVDKTPRYYAVTGLIEDIYPKAKKIILLRNPLDIFASYKSTWGIGAEIFTPEGVTVSTRDFCEGLFVLTEFVLAKRDDVLIIRYEDLATDAEQAMLDTCDFINLEYFPAMLDYYNNLELIKEYKQSPVGDPISSNQPAPVNDRTVNAWESRLNKAEIEAIVNVLGLSVFESLGYFDTVTRLKEINITIPSEADAFASRNILKQNLVKNIDEQPFSLWNNYLAPLKASQEDSSTRLEVIHQLEDQVASIGQQLEDSEADRAARLEVIHQLEAEVASIGQQLEVFGVELSKSVEVICTQKSELEKLMTFKGFLAHKCSPT